MSSGALRIVPVPRWAKMSPILPTENTVRPASVSRSNFHKYRHSTAFTDYHEFADRSHNIIVEKGWEEVAQYAGDWLEGMLRLESSEELAEAREGVLAANRPRE